MLYDVHSQCLRNLEHWRILEGLLLFGEFPLWPLLVAPSGDLVMLGIVASQEYSFFYPFTKSAYFSLRIVYC